MNIMIFIILLMTALSLSGIGSFLMLRNLSMLTDAISHSVLLGIVLAYFVAKDIESPLLIIGAALFGLITVFAIESLSNTGLVKNDDAVGIVFPLFFALAVILITKFARNVHIDTDVVLMGEVILAPLNTMNVFGFDLPKALVFSSIMFVINSLFIIIFFKELKVSSFDPDFASISGFSSKILFYALMTLASLSAVISFDSVGAILVISFFITPAATAYLISKDLKKMLILSGVFAAINCLLGFLIANFLNLSMSGTTATVAGVVFLIVLSFNKDGMIGQIYMKHKNKKLITAYSVLIHIGTHLGKTEEIEELGVSTINTHLNWDKNTTLKNINYLKKKNLVKVNNSKMIYELTDLGYNKYKSLLEEFNLA
ncbi:metal ABC transporter permease [Peptoniphilus sp. MSJ-1]|uniref:Metal ABC transporter permease n=1 Tax=Peptoniphilus ovalis TaxID=2841503 RepID=A0ABS6FEM1_9FIRM|nr:metal ABC transporter permease [Peptoniphilus ovalis]MBU5668633.1 metal ABC transporter permease [Peptoniphilus ovalis]